MTSRTIGVGIIGLGTVGYGTAEILKKNGDLIAGRAGGEVELLRVLEKEVQTTKEKLAAISYDPAIVTSDFDSFLATPGLDIVVELIGGTTVAKEFILASLHAKKSVVTANKDLMAIYGKELFAAADENGVDLRFEAAVAGGIPIIGALKNQLSANRFLGIMGIVNGTTNYILTRMHEEDADFDDVLKEAQELGYAEADPTADVGGFDAARKVAILASIAYNSRVVLDDVYVEGLENITKADIAAAKKLGYVIKLLAITKEEDGEVEARVHPSMIRASHPLATVSDTFNAIFVDGDAVGKTMFYGRGAGALPTGSAVAGDIGEITSSILGDYLGKRGCSCIYEKPIRQRPDYVSCFFMRMVVHDVPGVFAQVATCFGDTGVSIASVVQESIHGNGAAAHIILVTHKVREGRFLAAREALENLDVVYSIESVIRVENEI